MNKFSTGLIFTCVVAAFAVAVVAPGGEALAYPLARSVLDAPDLWSGLAFGSMVVNRANLSAVFTGFKAAFNKGFSAPETFFAKVATTVPSTTAEEKYGWIGKSTTIREWIGDRQVQSLALHDYALKNKKWESTVGVEATAINDDSYGVLAPVFEEMGFNAKSHPDQLVFNALAAGWSTPCFDGQFFFDTDHPVGGESGVASVSNLQAGAGSPWYLMDTRRPLKPLIYQLREDYSFQAMTSVDDEAVFSRDEFRYGVKARSNVGYGFWQMAFGSKATLDQTNFDAAFAAMGGFKGDNGQPLGIKPNLLVVGMTNRSAANKVIKAQQINGGDSNPNYDAVEVVVVPWLP